MTWSCYLKLGWSGDGLVICKSTTLSRNQSHATPPSQGRKEKKFPLCHIKPASSGFLGNARELILTKKKETPASEEGVQQRQSTLHHNIKSNMEPYKMALVSAAGFHGLQLLIHAAIPIAMSVFGVVKPGFGIFHAVGGVAATLQKIDAFLGKVKELPLVVGGAFRIFFPRSG